MRAGVAFIHSFNKPLPTATQPRTNRARKARKYLAADVARHRSRRGNPGRSRDTTRSAEARVEG